MQNNIRIYLMIVIRKEYVMFENVDTQKKNDDFEKRICHQWK